MGLKSSPGAGLRRDREEGPDERKKRESGPAAGGLAAGEDRQGPLSGAAEARQGWGGPGEVSGGKNGAERKQPWEGRRGAHTFGELGPSSPSLLG